ncbi:hypothetical protein KIN20_037552 [Parelaphostrongylus tenuis]|uniref:Uncharacterized protein n=1 Tax=Parelaphostrongylus tenuis TaxID=148309 RepID=A0AAD5REM7_PARTN|nr:hypothetical protein KIN20_037552 [Parelaphostrongylus tenuis]
MPGVASIATDTSNDSISSESLQYRRAGSTLGRDIVDQRQSRYPSIRCLDFGRMDEVITRARIAIGSVLFYLELSPKCTQLETLRNLSLANDN